MVPENKDIKKWVIQSYYFMNKKLVDDDINGIEKISQEAVVLQKNPHKAINYISRQ